MHPCPRCGQTKTRPSMQAGIADVLMRALLMAPVRCRCCRMRFYRFALPGSKWYVTRTNQVGSSAGW